MPSMALVVRITRTGRAGKMNKFSELWALYIHPKWWSAGRGRELWHAAHTRLTLQGFSSVSLWVLEDNARAIGFYAAAGFTSEAGSRREFELGGRKVHEIRMLLAG